MLQSATLDQVKTISQRELRNDNAEIMRGVEAGETYVVTRRGVPIARVLPYSEPPDLDIERPAARRTSLADFPRIRSSVASEEVLADLRGGDR